MYIPLFYIPFNFEGNADAAGDGVTHVAGSIITAPVIGVALFFVCVVAGQLIGSSIIDQLGAFELAVKPINTMKLIGISLVLLGAVLVQNSSA